MRRKSIFSKKINPYVKRITGLAGKYVEEICSFSDCNAIWAEESHFGPSYMNFQGSPIHKLYHFYFILFLYRHLLPIYPLLLRRIWLHSSEFSYNKRLFVENMTIKLQRRKNLGLIFKNK